jgi:MFS family permease
MSQNLNQSEEKSSNHDLRPLYARTVVNSFGSGTVSPFLGVYTVRLGASPSEMGWFQSISNLAPNLMQIPWGKLSDRLGRRVPFVLLGGLITALLWIPVMLVTSPSQLILVIGVQAVLGSMAAPAWTALIGELAHSSKRGITTAAINRSAMVGSLLATLASGYLMAVVTGTLQQMFFIPLMAAVICGVTSSLVMLLVHEKRNPNRSNAYNRSIFGIRDVVQQVRGNPDFLRLLAAGSVFGFFMSISWPLFSITVADVLQASMLEVALLSLFSGGAMIVFQPVGGKLADRVGRKQLILAYRLGLVTVPIFYGLATSMTQLYLAEIFFGTLTAFGDVAMFAYLLDVTKEEHRGTLAAFYNLVLGILYFIGSLLGGYLANYLVGIVGLTLGLQLVYALSAVGRTAGALTFLTLKEPYKYPSTLRKEIRGIVDKLPLMPERRPVS